MRVLLGITGSVAAYKGAYIARELTKRGYRVTALLTEGAQKFITPLQISSLIGESCYTDADFFAMRKKPVHIVLARENDLMVIAPATYDFIGKAANGIADCLLLSVFAAFRKPVLIAPAMHQDMWDSPILRENIEKLKAAGVKFIGPVEGELASGAGRGRMVEPMEIVAECEKVCGAIETLKGKTALIAYGRTEEDIDPVRVITNRSSGRMGCFLAERAKALGAKTILVEGEISVSPPHGDEKVKVRTHDEMESALKNLAPKADIVIMCAAVSDFKPARKSGSKIKRGKPLTLELEPTSDILREIAQEKRGDQIFVGFALESGDIEKKAAEKLKKKGVDIIVGNTLDAPGSDRIDGVIIDRKGNKTRIEGLHKAEVASLVFDYIANLLKG